MTDAVALPRTGAADHFDTVDLAILRVLGRDPRAAFADVGQRVGVHERTVARRLERMVATGTVRFTAALVPEYLGEGVVVQLAVRCAPGSAHRAAAALALRADTRSVEVSTGALQVFAELCVRDHEHLLTTVARLDGVTDVHTSVVLRLLLTANDWAPHDDEPTPMRRVVVEGRALPEPLVVDELDRRLVSLLERDARMPMTRLAQEMSVGETTARRRLTRLMDSHVLHLRLLAEPAVLGFPVEARFLLGVDYSGLDAAVRRLAEESSVRHLVIMTGRDNLLGYSSHASLQDLHTFTTRVFAQLPGLRTAETALLLRTYKRAGVLSG